MTKINPFTRTPGMAGSAFIDMHYADEIIVNFESDLSARFVYKIVGLRGSGKSVEYSKVINTLSKKKGWLVYTLSAAGDPVTTLIAKLSKESFIDNKVHTTSVSVGGSAEAELSEMIQKANDKGYKVLVGIDDIAKTPEMVKFLSIWGSMLMDDKKRIYFVCTGLSKNIEDFTDAPNLTFFKRSEPIETGPLNRYEIALMYRNLLGVDEQESVRLSKFTCGYAYAYQVLGSIYFDKRKGEKWEDIVAKFDRILFWDSYDLIWKSLTGAEQDFIRCVVNSGTGKASDIKAQMSHPKGYDSLRQRIRNKHLINVDDRGQIKIDLPRFKEYVKQWQSEE